MATHPVKRTRRTADEDARIILMAIGDHNDGYRKAIEKNIPVTIAEGDGIFVIHNGKKEYRGEVEQKDVRIRRKVFKIK